MNNINTNYVIPGFGGLDFNNSVYYNGKWKTGEVLVSPWDLMLQVQVLMVVKVILKRENSEVIQKGTNKLISSNQRVIILKN